MHLLKLSSFEYFQIRVDSLRGFNRRPSDESEEDIFEFKFEVWQKILERFLLSHSDEWDGRQRCRRFLFFRFSIEKLQTRSLERRNECRGNWLNFFLIFVSYFVVFVYCCYWPNYFLLPFQGIIQVEESCQDLMLKLKYNLTLNKN